MPPTTPTRIWDLPTRVFHWALVTCIVALIITGNVGGNAITWHMRFGLTVLALLVFRVLWGLMGGRWSRFIQFFPRPAAVIRYLRGRPAPDDTAGHNPLGAFSVFAMLFALGAQVATGLMTDDEIAFTGPLVAHVSGEVVSRATAYHTEIGKLILLALVGLHVAAIVFYGLVKGEKLVKTMISGDKDLPVGVIPSQDGWGQRLLALVCAGVGVGVAWWVASLGA